jgi:hypothetical protein
MLTLVRNAHARGKSQLSQALQAVSNEDGKTEMALEVRCLVIGERGPRLILSPGPL